MAGRVRTRSGSNRVQSSSAEALWVGLRSRAQISVAKIPVAWAEAALWKLSIAKSSWSSREMDMERQRDSTEEACGAHVPSHARLSMMGKWGLVGEGIDWGRRLGRRYGLREALSAPTAKTT